MAEDQSTNANVVLTADVDGYRSSIQGAEKDTSLLASSVDTLVTKIGNLSRSIGRGVQIFSAGSLAGMAIATQRASDFEKQMSTLAATAATTGPALSRTEESVRNLAKQFPVARSEAIGLVTQLTNLGVKSPVQINNLATSMVKLSGATGESLSGLTQGFVELSRTMGTLSGGQSAKYANSLYTISRQAGVATGSVLSFANAIAPMARASNIGQRELMGIATAFARAGADGFAGANTMNTMLADITRNIQYGSPEIRKYSDLIGVTVSQFKKMDRTEAITQIFEAIGKQGPNAVKILDQMGYDGIRAAKSITAVAQGAGGLRKAIQESVGAFSGDSLDKGAKAAFGGMNDQLSRLKSSIGDIGITIGSTFLTPLTKVVAAIADMTSGFAAAARAVEPITKAITVIAAGIATIGTIGLGPLAALATARMFVRTTTGTSFSGGLAAGRGVGFNQMNARQLNAVDRYTGGQMGRFQSFLFRTGMAAGQMAGPAVPGAPSTGAALLRAVPVGILNAGAAWQRGTADFYRNAVRAPYERQFMGGVSMRGMFDSSRAAFTAGGGGLSGMGASLSALGQSFKIMALQTGSVSAALGNLTRATVEMAVAATRASLSLVRIAVTSSLGMVGSAARSVGQFVTGMAGGPVGLSIAAIGGAYMLNQSGKRAATELRSDTAVGLDAYNEKLGIATGGLDSFASALRNAETALPVPSSKQEAVTATAATVNAASAPKREYTDPAIKSLSTVEQGVNYLRSLGNASPSQLQQASLDLQQRFPAKYQDIARQYLNESTGKYNSVGMFKAASKAEFRDRTWWQAFQAGGGISSNTPDQQNMKNLMGVTVKGILNNATRGTDNMSMAAATQRALPEIQKLLTYAFASKENADLNTRQALVNQLYDTFGIQLAMTSDELNISGKRMTGKDILKNYMTPQSRQKFTKDGVIFNATPERMLANAERLVTPKTDIVGTEISKLTTPSVSNTAQTIRQQIAGNEANTEAVGKFTEKLAAAAIKAMELGSDFGTVSTDLSKLATTTKTSEQALSGIATAALGLITQFRDITRLTMSRSEARAEAYAVGQNLMTKGNASDRERGRAIASQQYSEDVNFLKTSVLTFRQFNIQKERAQVDHQHQMTLNNKQFNLSMSRGERDFNRQLDIAKREHDIQVLQADQDHLRQKKYAFTDFEKSRKHAEDDFNLQRQYANDDYNKSVARANRDFATSETRATEDYNKSRLRSQTDFDKQMVRRAQAAAKAIYDPYKRITTLQTMDTQNLLINLQKQTKAIEDQSKNLETLRNAGVSQTAIDTLGLSETANAQQLARLTSDIAQNPNLINDINTQVAARTAATTALVNSDQNVEYRQAKEDFNLSMSRAADDFNTSLTRSRTDFAKSMADSATDFDTQLTRSDSAFKLSMSRSLDAYTVSIQRMDEEFDISSTRSNESFKRSLKDSIDSYNISVADAKQNKKIADAEFLHQYNLTMTRMGEDLVNSFKEANGNIDTLASEALTLLKKTGVAQTDFIIGEIDRVKTAAAAAKTFLTDLGLTGGTGVLATDTAPKSLPVGTKKTENGVQSVWNGSTWVKASGGYQETGQFAAGQGPLGFGTKGWDGQWKTYSDGSWHGGADYPTNVGSPVYATRDGSVINVQDLGNSSYGKYVKLSDGRYDYYYAHLSLQMVKPGQKIKEGTLIGYSGNTGNSTGPHLHYEVRPANAGYKEALNPANFMAMGGIVAGGPRRTVLGEAGPEAVIPLNSKGSAFMASTIKEALTSGYAVPARGGNYQTNASTSMDYSNNFNGPITVESNDPNELARKLEAKARMQRLVRPGSSR